MILSIVCNNESLKNSFSSFVIFIGSESICTKTRRKLHDYDNKRNVSKFQTKSSEGRGGGNSNMRNHNNNSQQR